MKSSSEMIRVEGAAAGYGGEVVWQGADFTINRGEFVAIIGPNGSGKTTLFRMLLGLQPPLQGKVSVFGRAPHRGDSRIGYVPQRHSLDQETNFQAFDLVRLGYSGHRWGSIPLLSWATEWDATWSALEAVGAEGLATKSISSMSGGELQRIFLAEALVSQPDLLLLDEPLASLDIRRARELVKLVDGLAHERGLAALLVSHDINPLIDCLDKVIYVANGRMAAGTPKEVLSTERLTALYGIQVEVLRDSRGNIVIVGGENSHPDEHQEV
jgi:zinc/manganese transport system ATP-binding protein